GLADEIYVRLADPSEVDEVQRNLDRQFWAVGVSSTSDLRDQNSLISDRVDDLVVVMGLVSLLIGGIGIINTMLVIVSRRTTEVAVLKTLGLQPREITVLFLVEAIIMGFVGSLGGIVGGWGLAFLTKGFAETFLGQSLAFTIALRPALAGIAAGMVITTVFGFLPTLAASQIRPAVVLRPSETMIPKTGRLSAFVAMVCLIALMSLLAQQLMGDLLKDVPSINEIVTGIGAAFGLLMALPIILGDFLSMRARRRGRSWLLHLLRWPLTLVGLTAAGGFFGYYTPALLILTVTTLLVGYMYLLFWWIIWAAGGGKLHEVRATALLMLFPAFWPLIPLIIGLVLPLWIIGRLIQRFAFIDLKIAMRGMLSTKSRGASTLLALVIGIFTLSVITMLVDSITKAFEQLLEDVTGGNVLVFTASASNETLDALRVKLEEQGDSIRSFSMLATYETQITSYWDTSENRAVRNNQFSGFFSSVDGRDITSNLPDVKMEQGRNLDPTLDGQPDAEGYWPAVILWPEEEETFYSQFTDFEVGDRIKLRAGTGSSRGEVWFVVVGISQAVDITAASNSNLYAPLEALRPFQPNDVLAIADVEESEIRKVRRSLSEVPGTFVLETRFINDLVNRLVEQFTSFPTLVAGLALFTGGFVIANSAALSAMERRREIGVMKAIGLQRERVLGMLLLENGLMGLIGGLIGVGVSFIMLLIILYQMFQGELGDKVPYGIAFLLMGLCITISLVAAIASVWSASGEKPLNTLRYE
ncbi:MAG: FtsX-like permease family protein, partial [Chloroflexi bacterium]|nr:FtsX-like permease family protein [Chloroflexota bacterium]